MPRILAAVLIAASGVAVAAGGTASSPACLSAGQWYTPAGEKTIAIAQPALLARLTGKQVVLLGERHDDADHHRWQLQVIAALHAQRPNLVIGMEMLPRRAQPVLDDWVTGQLTEAELLARTEWARVWGFDPGLYLPILHFARINRIPVVAVNVERATVSEIASRGFAAVSVERREGVGTPAAAGERYRHRLHQVFREHDSAKNDDAGFDHFVEAQLFWDRAFAEALAAAARRPDEPLVIGIMGSGHLANNDGVPRQLADLGIDAAVLLPVETGISCRDLPADFAQAVFALGPVPVAKTGAKPILGVSLEPGEDGVRIVAVTAGSVADKAGLKAGDILREVASRPVRNSLDVTAAVARQPPGTWLPVTVVRDGGPIDFVAKFPPAP